MGMVLLYPAHTLPIAILTPSPAALLHQEMVRGRAGHRQAMADRIARRASASASKEAMGNEARPSSAQPTPPGDDDDTLF
jgi:hypothetical protein